VPSGPLCVSTVTVGAAPEPDPAVVCPALACDGGEEAVVPELEHAAAARTTAPRAAMSFVGRFSALLLLDAIVTISSPSGDRRLDSTIDTKWSPERFTSGHSISSS